MILGLGTDIVEVDRIEKILNKDRGFVEKVFCPDEINYANSHKNKAEHFAARFAAKEALFKAMGTGWAGEMMYQEIEVIRDELGKPSFVFSGAVKDFLETKGITHWHVSLSHVKSVAIAVVILEG